MLSVCFTFVADMLNIRKRRQYLAFVLILACAVCMVVLINSPSETLPLVKDDSVASDTRISYNATSRRNTNTNACDNKYKFVRENVDLTFDYKAAMQKLNAAYTSQDDPELIRLIRDYYIVPPSQEPYNLNDPDSMDQSFGQAPIVDNRLNFLECGFYVECGAADGEWGTNTWFFEKVRKWSGLLIEADPENFAKLKSKNRKAFLLNACLNTEPHPGIKTFNMAFNRGRLENSDDWQVNQKIKIKPVQVQCFPLYSILKALGQDTVDFFSLDVEGFEMQVLETIPWDKLDIRTLTVEFLHGAGGSDALKKYVESRGYTGIVALSRSWDLRVNDIIFKKKA